MNEFPWREKLINVEVSDEMVLYPSYLHEIPFFVQGKKHFWSCIAFYVVAKGYKH